MLDSLRPHSAYKDSGEPWFGDIPAHWTVQRLKRCATRFYAGGTPDSGSADCYCTPPDGIPWLLIADMTRQRRVRTTTKAITERGRMSRRLEIIPKGTVLYSMYASLGTASILEIDATVNQAIIGISPNPQVLDREFFLYALENARRHLNVLATSSTQANLNAEKVKSLPIPLPPPAEQAGIVRFLGAVDRKVNRFIRAKRRLIEVLTEQKQAIITHAVTKGLNPHAPLKPSGIDWLGDVPEHWAVARAGSVAEFISTKAHEQFVEDDGEHICVTARFVSTDGRSFRRCTKNFSPAQRGDVLMVMSDLPRGRALARAYFVNDDKSYAVNQRVCILRPKRVNPLYLAFATNRHPELLAQDDGFNQTHLPNAAFKIMRLALPPLTEQTQIVESLVRTTSAIDTTIERTEREIDLIREYRTRLVADVVTGKVDVRVAAASIPDEPSDVAAGDQPGGVLDGEGDDADAGDADAEDAAPPPEEVEA